MKGHRDFHIPVTKLFREKKNLDIKAEAFNTLQTKNGCCCFPAEALVSALCVRESWEHNHFGE
jgi:hypothetical protein